MDNSTWVGVNTAKTNSLVAEAIENGEIVEFQNVTKIRREIKTSDHTRLDLLVDHDETSTFIEVKNCSLAVDGCAMFPDAVTARGAKHLTELTRLVKEGSKGCIFFLVQRMDADEFRPAKQIDPTYAEGLAAAQKAGVTVLVYQAEISPDGIRVVRSLPCDV